MLLRNQLVELQAYAIIKEESHGSLILINVMQQKIIFQLKFWDIAKL